MSENRIYKPKQISGFPEWLPEYRAVELQWMDKIRSTFERYGFCSIETPSVEEVDALLAKGGETEKEIYTLSRLQEDAHDKDSRLALHFDLTVPMARYVAQHFNDLVFPFKRYQIQKSWRGERPQKGRFREFYQCDIDVVNVDGLPLHFDAELPAVMFEAYQALDIPPVEMHISNRKIIVGYLQGLGLDADKIVLVTRLMDKVDKIGKEKVEEEVGGIVNPIAIALNDLSLAKKICAIPEIKTSDGSFADKVRTLGVANDLLDEGLKELSFVMDNLKHLPQGSVIADLGIIRGLDYYTGTVIEVRFKENIGARGPLSIGGGGRYDNLAGSFISQKLPGIGVSIGLTRLFAMLLDEGYIKPAAKCPTQVLVVLPAEERRAEAAAAAHALRLRGMNVELYHSATKVKKQLSYAEKKGIPYVWFPPFEDGQPHEVKNMVTGEQVKADPSVWKI